MFAWFLMKKLQSIRLRLLYFLGFYLLVKSNLKWDLCIKFVSMFIPIRFNYYCYPHQHNHHPRIHSWLAFDSFLKNAKSFPPPSIFIWFNINVLISNTFRLYFILEVIIFRQFARNLRWNKVKFSRMMKLSYWMFSIFNWSVGKLITTANQIYIFSNVNYP